MKNVKKSTIIRTILQLLSYINLVIVMLGSTSLAIEPWYKWLSIIFVVVLTLLSYWYNNDWTNIASAASDVYFMLKDGKITQEELAEFIEKRKNNNKKDDGIVNLSNKDKDLK